MVFRHICLYCAECINPYNSWSIRPLAWSTQCAWVSVRWAVIHSLSLLRRIPPEWLPFTQFVHNSGGTVRVLTLRIDILFQVMLESSFLCGVEFTGFVTSFYGTTFQTRLFCDGLLCWYRNMSVMGESGWRTGQRIRFQSCAWWVWIHFEGG